MHLIALHDSAGSGNPLGVSGTYDRIPFAPYFLFKDLVTIFVFIGKFLILMQLGAKHVESPFIEFGQISTVLYFAHFLIIVPFVSLLENSLIELGNSSNKA